MEGIILAAGIGSRLAPLTDELPKSLVPVNLKPILQYQIESYLLADIQRINIVVGYKGEKIEEFIKKHYNGIQTKFNIIRNDDYRTTNNMYSLYLALRSINSDSFILSNADVVVKSNLVKKILEDKITSGIAFQGDNYNEESMKVTINEQNSITKISKQILKENASGTSIDFYKFSGEAKLALEKEIFYTIEEKKDLNSWTEVAIDNILNSGLIKGINIGDEFWYEIDDHTDLENAEDKLANNG